jgi:hypothetical protein
MLGNSSVYLEQMALTTGINNRMVRDELKQKAHSSNTQSFIEIRDIFIIYMLKLDSTRISIPQTSQYRQLNEARAFVKDIRTLDRPGPRQQTGTQSRRSGGLRAKQFGVARKSLRGGKPR